MKLQEEEEPTQHKGKKKNTKRWCKGKVGREHSFTKKIVLSYMSYMVCTICGKHNLSSYEFYYMNKPS